MVLLSSLRVKLQKKSVRLPLLAEKLTKCHALMKKYFGKR
jgi:hypothetical protein